MQRLSLCVSVISCLLQSYRDYCVWDLPISLHALHHEFYLYVYCAFVDGVVWCNFELVGYHRRFYHDSYGMIDLEFNQKYTNGKRFPCSEGYDLGLEHDWKVNKMLVNEQQRANAYVSHSGGTLVYSETGETATLHYMIIGESGPGATWFGFYRDFASIHNIRGRTS